MAFSATAFIETMIKFAQHGYAVYVQDVRGRYESEGKWDPFRNEANDGYDTIEWAAKQPWSNGKVGAGGRIVSGPRAVARGHAVAAEPGDDVSGGRLDRTFIRTG